MSYGVRSSAEIAVIVVTSTTPTINVNSVLSGQDTAYGSDGLCEVYDNVFLLDHSENKVIASSLGHPKRYKIKTPRLHHDNSGCARSSA